MKSTGPRSILVEKWMGSSKDKAAVRTVCSHISNMSKVSESRGHMWISGAHLSYPKVSPF